MSRLIAVAVLFASFASLSAQDAQVIEAKGYIIPVNRVQVSARVPGVVSEILVREGEVVRKGDAIVRLDATAFQIDLQRAEANLQASEAKLRQILDSGNKVANPDQILAKAGLTKAQADRDMARYRLDATTIRSPIDGTLILVTPNVGDSLRGDGPAANPVCMICNLLELDVEVDIDEKSIRLIEVRQPCEIQLTAYPDVKIVGEVVRIVPHANRQKSTVPVRVRFTTPANMKIVPDLTATVRIMVK